MRSSAWAETLTAGLAALAVLGTGCGCHGQDPRPAQVSGVLGPDAAAWYVVA